MNTPALAAAGLYAALGSFILMWFMIAISKLRGLHKVSIGDGGVPQLIRVMRGHANAVENIPLFLIMLVIAALIGAPVIAIHLLGLTFIGGRVLHAWHFIQEDAPGWQRMIGFSLPLLAMLLLAVGLVGHALWAMMS